MGSAALRENAKPEPCRILLRRSAFQTYQLRRRNVKAAGQSASHALAVLASRTAHGRGIDRLDRASAGDSTPATSRAARIAAWTLGTAWPLIGANARGVLPTSLTFERYV
jgi:hypothetical protein